METIFSIEGLGVIFGMLYIIGAILEKWWCWPAGIIGVSIYGVSMFQAEIYGESILQLLYITISFYGWKNWSNTRGKKLSVSFSSSKELLLTIMTSIILFYFFWRLLNYFESSFPFWDALTNGFAIGATYLVARKKIENWFFWIFIDIILSIILYLKGFYFYSGLYLIYTFTAILGLNQWKKALLK
jgi:nicotinamide mononucleotide transporter